MTQTFDQRQRPSSVPAWTQAGRAIVVGVDGSERNHAAVAWAMTEATATGRPLTLLHVLDERTIPGPLHGLETDDQHAWRLVTRVEAGLRPGDPAVVIRKEVAVGAVDSCLVHRSAEQSTLVVGRRGLGSFTRLLVGSTSLSVASHARVPVVVVPERWSVAAHGREPVAVGVDHRDAQSAALHFAFAEAQRRKVPLIVAHARESHRDAPAADLDPASAAATATCEAEADKNSIMALESVVRPHRQAFEDVEVSLAHRHGHPLTVLLDELGPTQLLVLGRHSDRRRGGFPFGSVARGVLHYAEVPVAIVPND